MPWLGMARLGRVVDRKKKNGQPGHGLVYSHSLGDLVDKNDTGELKKFVAEHPEILARPLTFRPPRKVRVNVVRVKSKGRNADMPRPRVAVLSKGAMARAIKAGIIGKHYAHHMIDAENSTPK